MSRFYQLDGAEVPGLREARKVASFPSVTTVINGAAPHEYQYLSSKRLKEVLDSNDSYEEKLEILGNKPVFEAGSLVHEAAEIFFETGIKAILLDCQNSSNEFYKYLSEIEPMYIEKFYRVTSLGTGGRLDLVGSIGNSTIIFDYKTVATIKKKPEKSWILQMGAYYRGCIEAGEEIDEARIIQFSKKDKGVSVLSISSDKLTEASTIFSYLREAFKFYHDI